MKISKKLYLKVKKKTCTNYEAYELDEENVLLYGSDQIECMLSDLLGEIEYLEEQKEDIERDRDENYKPRWRDKYEEYGISERDFYE